MKGDIGCSRSATKPLLGMTAMARYLARFGGLLLLLIAVVGGILVERVIEAIAVGAVLFAVWTSLVRLRSASDDTTAARVDGSRE